MVISILLFYLYLIVLFTSFKFTGLDVSLYVKMVIFFLSAYLAIYPTIKKEGRLLNVREKLVFVITTWGVYTLLTLTLIISNPDKAPNAPGIAVITLNYFGLFCGIWVAISTLSEKLFSKVLQNA